MMTSGALLNIFPRLNMMNSKAIIKEVRKLKNNTLLRTRNFAATVVLTLFLIAPTIYAAGGDKPMSAEEMRKAAAAKAAAFLKTGGAKWGTTVEEALKALKINGDPEEGQEIYGVCAACHFPTGWGDPLGVFPQIAGQHATVLTKQIADIRAKNRDNPTMYPFAVQIEGAQDIADVSAYQQTLKMNPNPRTGPGGPSFILSNLRKEVWPISLDGLEQKVGGENFKKLKTLEEKEFKSKKEFLDAVKKVIGAGELEKHQSVILENADWTTDLESGKKLYEVNCVKCHGDHGQGNYKDYFPVVAGQIYLYMVRQFSWIKIGKRRNANPDMVKQIEGFSFHDMRSVVDYSCRFEMKEGDWKKIESDEDVKWGDEDEKDEKDDDKPAFMK